MKSVLRLFPLFLLAIACKQDPNSNCNNAIQDGTETAIDCGGDCDPCATCSDGIKNQDEVKVDCGGTCGACGIEYPVNGIYGKNILGGGDTLYISPSSASFRAIIPQGSWVKVELSQISGTEWSFSVTTNVGWSVGEEINGVTPFIAENAGKADLQIQRFITGGPGSFLVKFYENGASVASKQTVVIWE